MTIIAAAHALPAIELRPGLKDVRRPDEYDRACAAATLAGQLAELVYTLRTRAGLTQTELARRMGTTQSSIARIEGGGGLPTLGMLARLAHATGTPLRLAAPGITDVDLGGAA